MDWTSQNLGAIGEFISSIVIVIALVALIYEVRSSKQATLRMNAQDRRRARDTAFSKVVECPHLADIIVKAEMNLGNTGIVAEAGEYGLEPVEFHTLQAHFAYIFQAWIDAFQSDLSDAERDANDLHIAGFLSMSATLRKFYADFSAAAGSPDHPAHNFCRHVDRLLAENTS
ncbi:MAG: hypothetical protein P8Y69_11090 [Gammaproteobacteria bacterium]